jgi:hypothetical protein
VRPSEHSALNAGRRCRGNLAKDAPPAGDPDAVPAVLAREICYDVALLELAEGLGIATDPSRFEQPRHERAAWSRRSWTAASRCRQHPTPRTLRRRQLESVPATAIRCR